MLVEFSVENFLSIKEKVTLSMLASKGKENPDNLIELTDVPTLKGEKLLKSAAIYGANASGKSNFLKSLKFFLDFVRKSHTMQLDEKIDVNFFKLNKFYLNNPSKFNIIFVKDNIKYEYGFALNEEEVIDEYLYFYPKAKKSIIFERTKNNIFKFNIEKTEQEMLSERTASNKLYLSVAVQWNFLLFKPIYQQITTILGTKGALKGCIKKSHNNQNYKQKIEQFIKIADIGIENLETRIINKSQGVFDPEIEDVVYIPLSEEIIINFYHRGIDSNGKKMLVNFDIEEESEGTKRFFEISGILIDVFEKGSICVVDELEESLHPGLVKNIIELFHNSEINKNNAQLIFTTHETNLLNLDLLRRDQIWFTEKNSEDGSTNLYSLDEFSPRKDENIQKGYLQGRYGAIPFLGDWSALCPED